MKKKLVTIPEELNDAMEKLKDEKYYPSINGIIILAINEYLTSVNKRTVYANENENVEQGSDISGQVIDVQTEECSVSE